MSDQETGVMKGIKPSEVKYLRTCLPTILRDSKMDGHKIRFTGNYQIGYDPESEEVILFKSGKAIVNPLFLDELVYLGLQHHLEGYRASLDNSGDHQRFCLDEV
jgi:hypothetical protein